MKAASIAQRMADFLQRYPPFEFLSEEELVELASAGRVKFHENEEIIFTEGQPRTQFVYVINQGRVRIVEEAGSEERLIDYRGVGDLVGFQGVIYDEPYTATAKTETDVLLYALPREAFALMAEKSLNARRYLAANFTLNPSYHRISDRASRGLSGIDVGPVTLRKGGLVEVAEPQAVASQTMVTVYENHSAVDVGRRLRSKRVDCVVVIDKEGRPIGKITDADLRERFIEGRTSVGATAGELMFDDLAFGKPTDSTGKLLVRLTRSGKRFIMITADGTKNTRVIGLVSERNIFLQYGRFPTLLGEAMGEAPDVAALRELRDRVEALILEFLEDRQAIPWLMQMTGVLNRALTARILQLMEAEMAAEGYEKPKQAYSWLMMGSGGRDELLIRSAVYHALIYEDAPNREEGDQAWRYYRELGSRATEGIRRCGFLESEQGVLAGNPRWCLPVSEMYARYSAMIAEPVEENVYHVRDSFDFRPVRHRCPMAQALRAHIRKEIKEHPEFIREMARNSLLNQPPRTIFQGYVVDDQGHQKDQLEIKFHALLPLVDAARVLMLEWADIVRTSTHLRLRAAAKELVASDPVHAELLEEAAEAFLLAAHVRTQQGLLKQSDGAVIRPSDLDSETKMLMKTAFRTILATLDFLAKRYDVKVKG